MNTPETSRSTIPAICNGPLFSKGFGRRAKSFLPVVTLLTGVSLFAGHSARAADTEYDVINGQSNLALPATYTTGGTSGTGAGGTTATVAPSATSDVTFLKSTAYSPAAFTVGDSALTFGSINDLSGTALTISNSSGTAARVLTLGGGSVDSVTGSAAADLLYVATGGTLTIQAGTGNAKLGLALGQSGNFDIVGSATIGSVITGAFQLTKTGAGTLTLGGVNTYSGGTLVNAGTLSLTANTTGQTITVASGATLSSVTNGPTIATSTINLNGTGVGGNGAFLVLGNVAASSSVVLQGNTTIGGSSGFSGVINAPITDGGNGFGITKTTGNYTLTLGGANTFTGLTTIASSVLQVTTLNHILTGSLGTGATTTSPAASSSLGAPTTVANGTINIGATTTAAVLTDTGTGEVTDRVINLAGTTGGATITQSGTGALVFTSAFTATGAGVKTLTLSGSTTGTGAINGAIVDNSTTNTTTLTKSGTGTWTLSGANSYTGATTVSGGTLLVTGSTTGTSAVAVTGAGTVLGGTGAIGGTVTVGAGSIISAGAGQTNGTLTTGMLTLATTSTFNALVTSGGAAGTNYSTLVAGGTTALNGSFSITTTTSASFAGSEVLELISSPITNTFTNSTATSGGYTFTADYLTNPGFFDVDVSVAAVPEPSTWTAGVLLILASGFHLYRRFRSANG